MTPAHGRPYDPRIGGRPTARAAHKPTSVVDLAEARDDRRLRDYQARLKSVLDTNRRAVTRLFQSGLIFSRAGARLGRDLLLAHQHLLKVADLLAQLRDGAGAQGRPGARRDAEAQALYDEVQVLLARSSELSARSDGLLARER